MTRAEKPLTQGSLPARCQFHAHVVRLPQTGEHLARQKQKKTPMYEFPPPVWSTQDWSFGGVALCVLTTIAAVFAAKYTRGRLSHVIAWLLMIIVSLGSLIVHLGPPAVTYLTYAPHRYLLYCPLVIIVAGFFTLGRMYFTNARRLLHEAIVYAIIFVFFTSLVWWPGQRPVDVSSRSRCKNNLKQLALAMHNYLDNSGRFPPAIQGTPRMSWRVRLLPWIEQSSLLERYDPSKGWNSDDNRLLLSTEVPLYACPGRPSSYSEQGYFLTSYVAPTGSETMFHSESGTTMSDFQDGSSNTLMLMEACGSSIVWSEPRDIDTETSPIGINLSGTQFGQSDGLMSSWHLGGSQAALADGSVKFFSASTDPAIIKALLTRNGGEAIADSEF